MADRIVVRRSDGSGSGYLFSREDAKRFLAEHPDYAEEPATDEKAARTAAKAVSPAENKAVSGPSEKRG